MKYKIRNLLAISIGMLILSITTVSEARNPSLGGQSFWITDDSGNREEIKTQKGESKQSTTDKNYTYIGLKQNTAYTIVVEAIDKAENTIIGKEQVEKILQMVLK